MPARPAAGLHTLVHNVLHARCGKRGPAGVLCAPRHNGRRLNAALFEGWYAMAGPARLPQPIQDRLLAALKQVMADPVVRQRMEQQSLEPVLLGPAQLREVVRYRAIAARADIRLE